MADLELQPRFWVPLGVVGLGLACGLLSWIAAAVVVLFGCFLMLQTALLRLRFEAEALVVTRSGDEIRRFPYSDWMGWRVFWPKHSPAHPVAVGKAANLISAAGDHQRFGFKAQPQQRGLQHQKTAKQHHHCCGNPAQQAASQPQSHNPQGHPEAGLEFQISHRAPG